MEQNSQLRPASGPRSSGVHEHAGSQSVIARDYSIVFISSSLLILTTICSRDYALRESRPKSRSHTVGQTNHHKLMYFICIKTRALPALLSPIEGFLQLPTPVGSRVLSCNQLRRFPTVRYPLYRLRRQQGKAILWFPD